MKLGRRWWAVLPIALFVVLVLVFWIGLGKNPRAIPSPLINKPSPQFTLSTVFHPNQTLNTQDLKGKVVLFNVFASWCVACVDEHKGLIYLAHHGVPIYGLDYQDTRPSVKAWLAKWGNPYREIAFDRKGQVGVNWGIYGVPETFLINASGQIKHKFVGPITVARAKQKVIPMLKRVGWHS